MSHNRVVITGMGVITAVGSGREGLWRGIQRGESGIRRLTRFDASPFESQVAGEVTDFDPLAYFPARRVKRLDRFAQFALVAAKMALEDAQQDSRHLCPGEPPYPQIGVCTAPRSVVSPWRSINTSYSCARASAP